MNEMKWIPVIPGKKVKLKNMDSVIVTIKEEGKKPYVDLAHFYEDKWIVECKVRTDITAYVRWPKPYKEGGDILC